jgi:predicted ATP-grasp superfamily ATP-dependent carboligase
VLSGHSILVLNGQWLYSARVIRCLATIKDVGLHVISRFPDSPVRYSRHVASFQVSPEHALASMIVDVCKRRRVDIILPVDETASLFLARNRELLSPFAALHPTAEPDAIECCLDKWSIAEFARKHGIEAPVTLLGTSVLAGDAAQLGSAPVLVKPRRGLAGHGIIKFQNKDHAVQWLCDHEELAPECIVQEFVTGSDVDCSVLCRNGSVLAFTVQEGILPPLHSFGTPAAIRFVHDEHVVKTVRSLVTLLNWSGVCHIDMRYDPVTDRVHLLEINPRYWTSIFASLVAGVNFPVLGCLHAIGVHFDSPEYRECSYMDTGAAMQYWFRAATRMGPGRIRGFDTDFGAVWSDPLPELATLYRRLVRP